MKKAPESSKNTAKGKLRRPNFGLLHSYQSPELEKLELILAQYGHVKLINYDDTRSSIDMLFIPDGVGVQPNLPGFFHGEYKSFPYGNSCHKISRFFSQTFKYYDNLLVPIVGIGDGACYLWSQVGGRLAMLSRGATMLMPSAEEEQFKDYTTEDDGAGMVSRFQYQHLMGVDAIDNPKLVEMIKRCVVQIARDANAPVKIESFYI